MAFLLFFSFTLILTTTTTTTTSHVLPASSAAATTTTSDQFLAPHNQARRAVGVGPLHWAQNLTLLATQITNAQQKSGCGFANLNSSLYGANQAWASYPMGPAEAVGSWVSQGKYYNHINNTCAEGKQCGTYTQVVWRKSMEIGCAQVTCAGKGTLTVCMYNPHGNVEGQFPY